MLDMIETAARIRPMTPADAAVVLAIYAEGIETGHATFQSEAPDWPAWDRGHRADCRLVAAAGDRILGFAALSPTSARPVYAGVCEVSLYVAADVRGRRTRARPVRSDWPTWR